LKCDWILRLRNLRCFAQDDTLLYGHFGRLSDLAAFLLQEVHVRELLGEFLHLVGVGHEGGTCVPGAVEELAAGAVGKCELDGFVTHLERAAFGARHEFFARVCFDPGEDLVCNFVAHLVARNANSDAVTEEDFGVAFGDDGADAPALECLRSVFTTGDRIHFQLWERGKPSPGSHFVVHHPF